MTDDEIEKLAEEIVKKKGGFYVDPEDHYKQHQRLDRMLDIYDSASNIFFKAFIGVVFVGIFTAAALGLGWHK